MKYRKCQREKLDRVLKYLLLGDIQCYMGNPRLTLKVVNECEEKDHFISDDIAAMGSMWRVVGE